MIYMGNIDDILHEIKEGETKNNETFHTEVRETIKNPSKLYSNKMNIYNDEKFNKHLQFKLDKLKHRLRILQYKYNSYKRWYDRFNILIIVISSLLSIFEAFRNEISSHFTEDEFMEILFNMVPIGISSSITCFAAIVKFKKYQDKMEHMQFTREKVITAISKIKYIQETLWFANTKEDLDKTKKKYMDDIYTYYNESNSELERHIKYSDHSKLNKINKDNINKNKDNIIQKEKPSIVDEYYSDIDDDLVTSNSTRP
jgi:hypothetical protein